MQPIRGIQPPDLLPRATPPRPGAPVKGDAFADVLRREVEQVQGLKFSAHAQQRLDAREIQFSAAELEKVNDAVRDLASKGGREALLVLDKAALLVSVPNRTVITAVGTSELNQNVFTNIDSAVVIPSVDSSSQTK